MAKKGKGPNYERELARRFSNWWTNWQANDFFWRTDGSGGRATNRANQYNSQSTYGQYGDIAPTHPDAMCINDVFIIEIKRGYSKYTVGDLLATTAAKNSNESKFEEFIRQTVRAHKHSGAFAWLMIHRRDGRLPVVFFPQCLYRALHEYTDAFEESPSPLLTIRFNLDGENLHVYGMKLDEWFAMVKPEHIRILAKKV